MWLYSRVVSKKTITIWPVHGILVLITQMITNEQPEIAYAVRRRLRPKHTHKVSKGAKIRNRYNQVPHLTQDTNGKVTNSQLDTTNKSQEVSPFPAGDHKAHMNRRAQRHSKHKTKKKQKKKKKKNIKDPQKKYRLGTVSKIFYWRA